MHNGVSFDAHTQVMSSVATVLRGRARTLVKWRLATVADASYFSPMKTLSVKLPEPLAKWLASLSRQTRRSRSEIVREALEQQRNGRANGSKGARKRVTMADAMADLRGTISGPRDLSTNAKYLEGFGK